MLTFPRNGLQDVMFATAVSTGTKSTQITDASLKFEHLMTQLQFAVKYVGKQKGEWNGKSVSVKTIEILNAQLPKAVHFSNGQVDLTEKATFSVPSIITSGLDPKATGSHYGLSPDHDQSEHSGYYRRNFLGR